MKKKLLPLMLLAGGCMFAETHLSIGVGIGNPGYYGPQAAVVGVRPPCPGPGYTWTDGYRAAGGSWVAGYWAPPYQSYVAAPRYRNYRGRDWDRDRHDRDHDWDRDHDRDRGRGYGNGFRR
jgi:hypothetical protein